MAGAPSKTILLVEDDTGDIKLTALMLKHYGFPYALAVARDGAEALEYLNGTGAHAGRDARLRPALVLMDINMPRLNGFETLERIRQNPALADLPVAFLTSSRDPEDAERALRLGAKFLTKPWPADSAQFMRELEALLAERSP